MSEYEKMANDFAEKTGTKLSVNGFEYGPYFDRDEKEKVKRYIFRCRLTRGGKSYSFKFGQSINDGCKEPTIYDVLSCMQKSDVGTFENFCDEFGYDTDSRRAERVYKAVRVEWKAMERLFGDVLDELQEIC